MRLLKSLVPCLFLLLVCVACSNKSNNLIEIDSEDLFTLGYGNFEDELNLFSLSTNGNINTYFSMRDGFFYIANGESKKLLTLNSYGNLLRLHYNPDSNLEPSFGMKKNVSSTKKSITHEFNTLGPVAVDAMNRMYVVDVLPKERQEHDEENKLLLEYVVLRFDSDGNFIDYIGQQGPGGVPFSYIKNIYMTKENELVVVCVGNDRMFIYWFNKDGFQKHRLVFNKQNLPQLADYRDGDPEVYPTIENIIPDYRNNVLYVKVDYYQAYLDPDLKILSGMTFVKSMLYPYSLAKAGFETGVEIPGFEDAVKHALGTEVYETPFEFIGVSEKGWFFFVAPIENKFLLQVVQLDHQKFLKRILNVNQADTLYYHLFVNEDGILSGLFAGKENAKVLWWRTDNLTDNLFSD